VNWSYPSRSLMLSEPATVSPVRRADDERTISTCSINSAGMRSRKNEWSDWPPGTRSPLIRIWV